VEKLDRLMVRMIAGELAGRRNDPTLGTLSAPWAGCTDRSPGLTIAALREMVPLCAPFRDCCSRDQEGFADKNEFGRVQRDNDHVEHYGQSIPVTDPGGAERHQAHPEI